MKINKAPLKFWDKYSGTDPESPELFDKWVLDKTCGQDSPKEYTMDFCAANVTLEEGDVYITAGATNGVSVPNFWWRCPFCGKDNPLKTSEVVINHKPMSRETYLKKVRGEMAKELLESYPTSEQYTDSSAVFLASLGIDA